MAIYADRVKDSTTSSGTGSITLANSAPAGYQTFATAFGSGTNTVTYCIAEQSGSNWEVGTGSFNGSTVLTRATVFASSSGGAKVNFGAGTKDVFCTVPAKYLTRVTKSTTAPSGAIEGDTWLDPSTGSWLMYLESGGGVASSGWVEIGRP